MSMWPLKFSLDTQGEGHWEKDELNNDVWVPGPPITVKVFAHEVIRSEEQIVGGHPRLVEELRIYAPPGTFIREAPVTLPDGSKWELQGNPEDQNNNPFWAPGLVTYHGKRTE